MSTITGLYKLNLEEDQSNILEENAKLHKRFSRITFKVIKFNPGDRVLMIRVSQNKSIHQNQMLVQDLARICRKLFIPNAFYNVG